MIILKNKKVIQHIPKTAGTSLKRELSYNIDMVLAMYNHSPLSRLKCISEEYKDYEVVAIVRHPVDWYNSWYNYTRYQNKINCPLTQILLKYSKDIDEFTHNALYLNNFFTKDMITEAQKHSIRISFNHVNNFIPDWQKKDLFNNDDTLYSFFLLNQIDSNTVLFNHPHGLEKFREYIGLDTSIKSPKVNITKYKDQLSPETGELILKREIEVLKLYNNSIRK